MSSAHARPFFSFIICTYHRAKELQRCLGSVLAIPDQDIEIIVNDNASPDTTPEAVASFGSDPRIHYFRHASNIGLTANFLHAVERARGQWIFILTDDDALEASALPDVRTILQHAPETGMLLSAVKDVEENGIQREGLRGPADNDLYLRPGPAAAEIMGRWSYILSRQIIRRSAIELDFYAKTLGYSYFCSIVAARIALLHPTIYLHRVMVYHTVDNIQHWGEWGGDWADRYFRTHMDDTRTLAVAFDASDVDEPWRRRRWVARVLFDYARLPWRVGFPGFIRHHGLLDGLSRLRKRLHPLWWPWFAALLICSVVRQWSTYILYHAASLLRNASSDNRA